jgi:hypothetical protein
VLATIDEIVDSADDGVDERTNPGGEGVLERRGKR